MKALSLFIAFPVLLILIWISLSNAKPSLQAGAITFEELTTRGDDSFSIQTQMDIPKGSIIRFTDSEWNGNRFGADEGDIVWNSGNNVIPAGTLVIFQLQDSGTTVTHGSAYGTMRLSNEREALFAYVGSLRLPTGFLAVISNDTLAYGTLLNTGLVNTSAAVTFQ